jgi:hypothetical protein
MYTLQEKTRLTRHTHPALSPPMISDHTYLMRSTHSNLLWSHQQIYTNPLPRRPPNTIHSSTVVWSVGPYPASPPQQPIKQWEKISFCWQPATKLIGSISPACDRYVQYLLAEANPSVLNQSLIFKGTYDRHVVFEPLGHLPWPTTMSSHS